MSRPDTAVTEYGRESVFIASSGNQPESATLDGSITRAASCMLFG